jgi:hypothetical protein
MIPGDRSIPIRSLDAESVLSRERALLSRSEYAAMERRKTEREEVAAS